MQALDIHKLYAHLNIYTRANPHTHTCACVRFDRSSPFACPRVWLCVRVMEYG